MADGRTLNGNLQSDLGASIILPQSMIRLISDLLYSHSVLVVLRGTVDHKAACSEPSPPRPLSSHTWTRRRLSHLHRAGLSLLVCDRGYSCVRVGWAALAVA